MFVLSKGVALCCEFTITLYTVWISYVTSFKDGLVIGRSNRWIWALKLAPGIITIISMNLKISTFRWYSLHTPAYILRKHISLKLSHISCYVLSRHIGCNWVPQLKTFMMAIYSRGFDKLRVGDDTRITTVSWKCSYARILYSAAQ